MCVKCVTRKSHTCKLLHLHTSPDNVEKYDLRALIGTL